LHLGEIDVGQLGGDHGTFFQLDQGDHVGGVVLKARRRVVDGRVGVDLAQAGEGVEFLGRRFAFQANVARREELHPAVGAHFADERVTLLIETPMT